MLRTCAFIAVLTPENDYTLLLSGSGPAFHPLGLREFSRDLPTQPTHVRINSCENLLQSRPLFWRLTWFSEGMPRHSRLQQRIRKRLRRRRRSRLSLRALRRLPRQR